MPFVQKANVFVGSDVYSVTLNYNNFIATKLDYVAGEKVLNTQMTTVPVENPYKTYRDEKVYMLHYTILVTYTKFVEGDPQKEE